jgi:hypothetical protein
LTEKPDFFAFVVGPPKSGKSSLAEELVRAELAAGSVAFVQDQNAEFGHIGPTYDTADDWRAAAQAASVEGAPPLSRAAVISCRRPVVRDKEYRGADQLIHLALELGDRWNRVEGRGIDITLWLNEASSLHETKSTHIGPLQEELINQRRHVRLRLVYCLQRVTQLPAPFWDVLTHGYLFQVPRDDRIDLLEKNLARVRKGELACLSELPRHRYVRWTMEGGIEH